MADNSALRAEASNPTTDPARLAAIAHEDPSLGAVVAANPAAYDGLLDWLLQYGDDEAKRAVGMRRGTIASPAPVIAPVAPVGYAAAPKVKTPMSPGLKKGLLFGGIGLAAVAVVAVAAVVVVNVLGAGSSAGIRTAEIVNEPRDDAWELFSPQVDDADEDYDTLTASMTTVGQDRALAYWHVEDEGQADPLTSLIDTRTGTVLWTIDDFEHGFTVVSPPGVTPYLVSESNDEPVISAIDPGSGDIISDTSKLENMVMLTAPGEYGESTIGGDLIIRSDDGIGRYSPDSLEEEKWMIDWDYDDDEYPQLAGSRIIIGDEAYSTETGEQVDWDADEDLTYIAIGDYIIGGSGDSDDAEIVGLSESGEELWSYDVSGSSLTLAEGSTLILANYLDDELVSLNLANGEENWAVDADFGAGGTEGTYGGADSGVIFVGAGDRYELTAFDISTGEDLYSFETSEEGESYVTILGTTSRIFYAAGGEDGDLIGYDIRTGDELWTLDNPDEYRYSIAGGQIIGIQSRDVDDAEDEPVIIGIQP